ncbi:MULTISPECIES: sulfonate ABC transporter substrate-binding protein [unclassified Haematobacter]|uniref:sulfonate ABC transporter substrate-binding protein n=1 Tax=unclassified Haematobacter TaxID=2640585 RepID=UPI0025BC5321|nr:MULTISPECIES: sulfonate ABC transporter substrate-binding protein [unclassified Haematobacter]
MKIMKRTLGLGTALLGATLAMGAQADVLKIGYQKAGLPVIARQQHLIEDALKPAGVDVQWVEFSAGPPLVEALNTGAIQVGWTGDAPPIFGQSAGAAIVYVAALPSNGKGEAIIARADSGIATLADLKGKRVAVGKGTSAHNLLVAALENAGLAFTDIEPVYLSPADAAAAFASGKVDAWSIWDPFLAIAETRQKPVVLAKSSDVLNVNTYFLANRDFAAAHGSEISGVIGALEKAAAWADQNRDKVAEALHEVTGVPMEAQTLAANRAVFGVFPITPEIIAHQQETADRFYALGLIPNKITVSEAVWTAPRS